MATLNSLGDRKRPTGTGRMWCIETGRGFFQFFSPCFFSFSYLFPKAHYFNSIIFSHRYCVVVVVFSVEHLSEKQKDGQEVDGRKVSSRGVEEKRDEKLRLRRLQGRLAPLAFSF